MSKSSFNIDRDKEICRLYLSGITQFVIAKRFLLSKARVGQILRLNGYSNKDGGDHTQTLRQQRERKTRREFNSEQMCQNNYGCSTSEYKELSLLGKNMQDEFGLNYWQTPITAFQNQRRIALQRNIIWNLTLLEWWGIWTDSKKWPLRGRLRGLYVMSRFEDRGAYEVGNVFIQTCSSNATESIIRRYPNARTKNLSSY